MALMLLCGSMPSLCAAKGWESSRIERSDAKQVARDNDVEIRTARDMVIVSTNHTVQIKVFTILGQQVSSETLGAGTHHFTAPAHGVYIIKVGDITCKVAL